MDFITQIFDTSDFPARWTCGNWTAGHGWLHIVSDLGVWSAYVAIPLVIGFFLLRKKDLPFRGIFVLFGAFILACGATHLMEAVIFWWPAYRLAGVIKLLTAIVSWSTVIALIPNVPRVLAMRSPEAFEREIAARQQAEAALQQANEFFSALLESLQEGIVACDSRGVLTLFNTATRESHGLPHEPISAEGWAEHYDLFHADGATRMKKDEVPLYRALAGERVKDAEMVIAPKGMPPRTLLANGQSFRDGRGNLLGAVVSMHDITRRKQAEEALQKTHDDLEVRVARRTGELADANAALAAEVAERRRAEEHVERVADAVPALISYVDSECRYRLNNRAYETWFGRPKAEIAGRHMREVVGEQAWKVIRPKIEAALAGEVVSYEARAPYRDGGERWISATCVPDFDDNGVVRGIIAHVNDITAHKQVEEALYEADRRKDDFLAILAHELRNPLAPLRNGLQVMKLAGGNAEASEQARTMMERQLEQLVHLVDDLLDVSRITQGKVELRQAPIDLAAVVASAVETCEVVIKERGHELTVTLPNQPVFVEADRTRLAQALGNLLSNAAKYTGNGGRIELSVASDDSAAVVRVKDNGVGIPEAMLPKVFEMFVQVDRSLEKSQGGLGIGLTIVKRLVELHGGTVEAHSEGRDRGSEFVVRLPKVAAPAATGAKDGEDGPKSIARLKVLVVDDNRDSAQSMAMLLGLMGNETYTASDGLEAIGAAEARLPDLILMDVGMPRLNGFDATRRIREQPWGKTMVIVALTGWGQEEDRRKSQEAGCNGHLVKPVDPAEIEKLLAQLRPTT